MIDMAASAKRVHEADWYVKASEGNFGRGEATLLMRGGVDKTHLEAATDLAAYVKASGEISLRLLRPADGVVIGKMMKHLSDVGMLEAGSEIEERLVKAFTVYLRGE